MVNVYKLTVMVIDHDNIGLGDVISVLKNTRYPNHCINPEVMASETKQIEWGNDDHPLNFKDKRDDAFKQLRLRQDMDFWTTALACLMAIFVRDILRSLIRLAVAMTKSRIEDYP